MSVLRCCSTNSTKAKEPERRRNPTKNNVPIMKSNYDGERKVFSQDARAVLLGGGTTQAANERFLDNDSSSKAREFKGRDLQIARAEIQAQENREREEQKSYK